MGRPIPSDPLPPFGSPQDEPLAPPALYGFAYRTASDSSDFEDRFSASSRTPPPIASGSGAEPRVSLPSPSSRGPAAPEWVSPARRQHWTRGGSNDAPPAPDFFASLLAAPPSDSASTDRRTPPRSFTRRPHQSGSQDRMAAERSLLLAGYEVHEPAPTETDMERQQRERMEEQGERYRTMDFERLRAEVRRHRRDVEAPGVSGAGRLGEREGTTRSQLSPEVREEFERVLRGAREALRTAVEFAERLDALRLDLQLLTSTSTTQPPPSPRFSSALTVLTTSDPPQPPRPFPPTATATLERSITNLRQAGGRIDALLRQLGPVDLPSTSGGDSQSEISTAVSAGQEPARSRIERQRGREGPEMQTVQSLTTDAAQDRPSLSALERARAFRQLVRPAHTSPARRSFGLVSDETVVALQAAEFEATPIPQATPPPAPPTSSASSLPPHIRAHPIRLAEPGTSLRHSQDLLLRDRAIEDARLVRLIASGADPSTLSRRMQRGYAFTTEGEERMRGGGELEAEVRRSRPRGPNGSSEPLERHPATSSPRVLQFPSPHATSTASTTSTDLPRRSLWDWLASRGSIADSSFPSGGDGDSSAPIQQQESAARGGEGEGLSRLGWPIKLDRDGVEIIEAGGARARRVGEGSSVERCGR